MTQRERTERYRKAGAGSGMVRVEVLVPPEGRAAILKEASRLRRKARGEVGAELEQLHEEAVRRFGPLCLWNASPSKTIDGLRVVADRLRRYGGMDAWKLAARIREELARTT